MARIRHKSVVEIYDRGFTGDEYRRPFFIMEFVPGESLRDVLKSLTKLPELVAVGVGIELAEGVHYMHKAGVIHCDIKPENVFIIVGEGGVGVAKLMDFGGIVMTEESPRIGKLFTPRYAAPEVLRVQEISDKCDVFSFGMMLYEMISGVTPFQGKQHTMEACVDRVGLPIPPLSDHGAFNAELVELVGGMMATDPDRRPKALEVGRKLQRIHRQLENALGDVHTRATMRNLTQVRDEESRPIRMEDFQASTTPDPIDPSIFGFVQEAVDAHGPTTPSPVRNQETRQAKRAPIAVRIEPSAPNPSLDPSAETRPPKKELPEPDLTGLKLAEPPEEKKENTIPETTLDASIVLVVSGPKMPTQRYVIEKLPCVLGREQADVLVAHRTVSARHAAIFSRRGKTLLVDLESANGTWLGRKRLAKRQAIDIVDGLQFALGDVDVDVEIGQRSTVRRWMHVVSRNRLLVAAAVAVLALFAVTTQRLVLGRHPTESASVVTASTTASAPVIAESSAPPIFVPATATMTATVSAAAVVFPTGTATASAAPALFPTPGATTKPAPSGSNNTDFLRKIGGGL